MATRKSNKPTPPAEKEANDEISATPTETIPDTSPMDLREERQQLAELRELTRSLMAAVQIMNAQNARNELLRSTIDDVKDDVKAAARAMLVAPHATAATTPHHIEQEGKCPPCDCVSERCCCFDIILSKVRATRPQIELPDIGDVPIPIPTINALEVQIYVTVGGLFGFLFPGIASTFDLRASGLPGGPGPWVCIERPVHRVCIKKGTKETFTFEAQVREHDEGAERPLAFKDEIGEASASITLDCCTDVIYPPMPLDVHLVHGGEGGGIVTLAFYARRVCC